MGVRTFGLCLQDDSKAPNILPGDISPYDQEGVEIMKKILLLCLGGFIFAAYIGSLSSQNHIAASYQRTAKSEPEKPGCDARKAKELVDDLINKEHILRHIKTTSSIPKVTVDALWYTLDFETKKLFNNALACYLANGDTSEMPLVAYLDPRTGKKVAQSGPHGFSME